MNIAEQHRTRYEQRGTAPDPQCHSLMAAAQSHVPPRWGASGGQRLNPGEMPPHTRAGPVKRDWFTLLGAFALAFATPSFVGDGESLEAGGARVEEEWTGRQLR